MDSFEAANDRHVSSTTIQRAFNEGRFYERARSGELAVRVHENSLHFNRRQARTRREPYCTRSQMVSYFEQSGRKVAVIHQYRRRDGTLGASGLPDPKWLRVLDEIWIADFAIE